MSEIDHNILMACFCILCALLGLKIGELFGIIFPPK